MPSDKPAKSELLEQCGCPAETKEREYPTCAPHLYIGEDILFVDAPPGLICPHQISYGDGWVCKCPVRIALYREYAA